MSPISHMKLASKQDRFASLKIGKKYTTLHLVEISNQNYFYLAVLTCIIMITLLSSLSCIEKKKRESDSILNNEKEKEQRFWKMTETCESKWLRKKEKGKEKNKERKQNASTLLFQVYFKKG